MQTSWVKNVNIFGLFVHITIYGHFCQKHPITQIFAKTLIQKLLWANLMHVWKAALTDLECENITFGGN